MNTSITLNKTDFKSVKKALQNFENNDIINIYSSEMDEIDKMIFENRLKIIAIHFHKDMDLMLILLNNKRVLKRNISEFNLLNNANKKQLENYEISRIGVHWPEIDEDLSLRGFIKHEIVKS